MVRGGINDDVLHGNEGIDQVYGDAGRDYLFGDAGALATRAADWHLWLVPLLAVPQLTHYVLDGLLWRRSANPRLGEVFARSKM